jgi:6,7-dimethyl-8-ribityllumazine synthase
MTDMEVRTGKLRADGRAFAVVVARFNDFVTSKLLEGAVDMLSRLGAAESDITVAWVPGAYEIPLAASKLAGSGKYAAVICLGTVIRGETPHFDFVAGQCASGIAAVALETGVPVIMGVLTTETLDQAINRAGGKMGNKGAEAAAAAVEMADLAEQLAKP